ncbi:MAG TPA: 2Fe-2S iron-sulfur cluster-binding protein [Candidatus Acidoferrum sp.]|nr:2Fe-2S iron-sulfur cluster-binding protein [Candidatus Acidoferrum sp.]
MRSDAATTGVITVRVNQRPVRIVNGASVAVAVLAAQSACRISVTGENRAPLCGMGTCFECRVTIDGKAHQRGCQITCIEGMEIRCDE